MTDSKKLDDWLDKNILGIGESVAFISLWSPGMQDFKHDPTPAVQLAIAILLDKPLILAVPTGRTPPKKLLAIADAVVYGNPEELALGIKEAVIHLDTNLERPG